MSRQTSIQLTEATERQAKDLTAAGFGSFTDVVRIAIDRMYQQEVPVNGNTFERKGEWAGYSVHEAPTGFVVDFWSRVQGENDGGRYLVPFSERFPKGLDLTAMWNESTTNGEAIAQIGLETARTLRRGQIVG